MAVPEVEVALCVATVDGALVFDSDMHMPFPRFMSFSSNSASEEWSVSVVEEVVEVLRVGIGFGVYEVEPFSSQAESRIL